jgi:hypothetical protein
MRQTKSSKNYIKAYYDKMNGKSVLRMRVVPLKVIVQRSYSEHIKPNEQ